MMEPSLKGALGACVFALCLCVSPAHAVSVSGQGTWETTLLARDFDGNLSTVEGWYDTVLGITWLADANYAMTSGYDADGLMSWSAANAWAAGLNVYGISGWRLPDINPIDGLAYDYVEKNDGTADIGYNISASGTLYAGSTASEMAYMYYNTLGNLGFLDTSGSVQSGGGLTNSGPFSDLQVYFYWSLQAHTGDATRGLGFGFANGRQRHIGKTSDAFAWAVHAGDVGTAAIITSPVPVPPALWLFGSGLLGLVGIARRKGARA